jgi:hypothetical protein
MVETLSLQTVTTPELFLPRKTSLRLIERKSLACSNSGHGPQVREMERK